MEKDNVRNIRLGIFVVVGAILLIITLYYIGDNKNIFGSTFKLNTTFRNVGGLQTGNNVRYAGIDIGTVVEIVMINDTSIHVVMVIDSEMKKFIRTNAVARIGTDGLMGNRLVSIEPGNPQAPFIEADGEIPSVRSVNTEAMLRTLDSSNENVELVSANLKNITDNINKGQGNKYSALLDTSLSTDLHRILDNIESVTNDLASISREAAVVIGDIRKGDGVLGALIYDTVMTNDLQASVNEIKNISNKISASSQLLKEVLNKFNQGNGTVSVLMNDSISAENLQQIIVNIKKSSEKLDEDLEGLKHSFLLKGYFRKQAKVKKGSNKSQKIN